MINKFTPRVIETLRLPFNFDSYNYHFLSIYIWLYNSILMKSQQTSDLVILCNILSSSTPILRDLVFGPVAINFEDWIYNICLAFLKYENQWYVQFSLIFSVHVSSWQACMSSENFCWQSTLKNRHCFTYYICFVLHIII